jgi:antitoxin (DNA-binding transcriptional repressor) of toxin-antitoxin stability system
MTQVNMLEAKTELSRLVKLLETKQEDVIYLARNGTAIAQLTLIQPQTKHQRIGVAQGKFQVPDAFDDWDAQVETLFGGSL